MFTTSCFRDHIRDIQCKSVSKGEDLMDQLRQGDSRVRCTEEDIMLVDSYLDILYCYKTFDGDPEVVMKFTIERGDDKSITIEINDDNGITWSVTSSGTAHDIISQFKSDINGGTTSPDYSADISGNDLYVYSTESGASFSPGAISITSGSQNDSVSQEDITDDPSELLNIWNDITTDEVCGIITNAKDRLTSKC